PPPGTSGCWSTPGWSASSGRGGGGGTGGSMAAWGSWPSGWFGSVDRGGRPRRGGGLLGEEGGGARGSRPRAGGRRHLLAVPEATETMTWGQPHFRVRGKIFAGFGDYGGMQTIGFKLEREHADAAVQDPRFTRAPYVGAHGWISMDVKGVRDWREVRALVLEGYRLIAPKTLWAGVQGGKEPGKAARRRKPRKRAAASRTRKRSSSTRR